MIKERTLISGDLKSKVKQLMEYAGWYEGRKVDIFIAEQYYTDHGVPMMKTVTSTWFEDGHSGTVDTWDGTLGSLSENSGKRN